MARGVTAVPKWSRMLARGETPLPDVRKIPGWSEKAADLGWAVLSELRMVAVPGVPSFGECSPSWMRDVSRFWLGAQDPVTQHRAIDECLLTISKKNGKTTLFALLALVRWMMSHRDDAQCLFVAPTIEVSRLAFRTVRGAVEHTPGLSDLFTVNPSHDWIVSNEAGSQKTLKVMSASPQTVVGVQATDVVLDELHLMARKTRVGELLSHIRGARLGRPDAALLISSTHAHERGYPAWEDEVRVFRQIRDGKRDDPRRVYISYEWTNEQLESRAFEKRANWPRTNPSLGAFLDADRMHADGEFERAKGREAYGAWLNQFCNVPPGSFRGDNGWIGMKWWDECYEPEIGEPGGEGLRALCERCDLVVCGIDGGGMKDLLGFVVLGRETGTERWLAWAHAWAHYEARERSQILAVKLDGFAKRGDLTYVDSRGEVVEGEKRESIDIKELTYLVAYLNETELLPSRQSVGVDDVAGVDYFARLTDDRVSEWVAKPKQLVSIAQGGRLRTAIEGLPRIMARGDFGHCGSEVFRWCCECATIEPVGANSVRASKRDLSEDAKIDLFIALMMATNVMTVHSTYARDEGFWGEEAA